MPDTIVACISGLPPAAVAWVRLSGQDAFRIASKVFEPWPTEPAPRQALYGRFCHGDDGFVLPFVEGSSFTGEESVELSIHGGRASIRALLSACQLAGARTALPGEFTLRAFMNGRIDLTRVEAIADTVEAETDRQLREANRIRGGALALQVGELRGRVLDTLARLEASVDFSEEVGEVEPVEIYEAARSMAQGLEELIEFGRNAHLARQGLRVAILGRPNAGKSSLFNALLGIDRAIVTEIAGTTRDTVEEAVELEGIKVVLTDTAGLRETGDLVERLGVDRSHRAASQADLVLYVHDSSSGWIEEDEAAIAAWNDGRSRLLVIGSKCDRASPERGLAVSSKTGEGLHSLISKITEGLTLESGSPAINDRQNAHLQLALDALNACVESAWAEHPHDLLSVLLNEVAMHLGRVTGETASPDMLEEIFSRFCIGK